MSRYFVTFAQKKHFMAVILNIDTSTDACSAALTAEGQVLTHFEDFNYHNHAALLSDMIKGCMDHLNKHELRLDAVAVTTGPGSYTGLRIGLSEAKGIAYALDIPMIGVNTLELMAVKVMFMPDITGEETFIPMIDARRMEVYTAIYDMALTPLLEPKPLILDQTSYEEVDRKPRVLFFGNGSDKARELLEPKGFIHVPDVMPVAADMLALSERAFSRRDFLDTAYSTPLYLKDFQATRPKKLF